MKSLIIPKSLFAFILNSIGVVSWKFASKDPYSSVILMYHRILPLSESKDGIQSGMYVEPITFEVHLRFLLHHFEIVPASAFIINSKKTSDRSNRKGFCILTFDDGYYDFYKYAYPILKKYRIPATLFLPTDFIGTNKWFWIDALRHLLFRWQRVGRKERMVRSKNSCFDSLIKRLENLKGSKESIFERAVQMLKAYRDEKIESILTELSIRLALNPLPRNRPFLDWGEVREMAQSGLITFGSHTAGHRILTTLTDDEIQDELSRSREKLIAEKVGDESFMPFSYPNGNYNEVIAKMVKEVGYSLAVTTESGWNHPEANLFSLRRIGIHQDMASTEPMLGCRIGEIF